MRIQAQLAVLVLASVVANATARAAPPAAIPFTIPVLRSCPPPRPNPTILPPITMDPDYTAEFQEAMRQHDHLRGLIATLLASPSPAPAPARNDHFIPIERDGLILQITSISASLNINQHRFGQAGIHSRRNLQIAGAVYDLSGTRAFRIASAPRLIELTDQNGKDLLPDATWNAYPDQSNPQTFTRAADFPGNMTSQNFSLSSSDVTSLPTRIGRLRIAVDIAVVGAPAPLTMRAQVTSDFQQLAPGIHARLTALKTEGGQSHIGIEYRLDRDPEAGPDQPGHRAFFRAEILDDEQNLLATIEQSQEVMTRQSVVGALSATGIPSRAAPVWTVRLYFVPPHATIQFDLLETDLPLMGQ